MAFAPPVALDYLRRAHADGRLGHAYLLIGGAEAFALAQELAALVVRGSPAATILKHPDVHVIEPESKSRRIVIEQVRDLEDDLRLRASAAGGRKVGIIREADRLQVQASNAFLKTLEEPPAESMLLLVSAQPESLPETILSRCVKVALLAPRDSAQSRTDEEAALADLLARHARDGRFEASISASYLLLREFTALLASVRARVQTENEAALDREDARYAQTTDGSWLGEREGYYKTLTEARYLAERNRLIGVLGRWQGDVLREAAAQGQSETVLRVLPKLTAIEELRENLDRNIQEALALEVAFLQVFGS
jgi:DNA polymerase-3 subunit delta'